MQCDCTSEYFHDAVTVNHKPCASSCVSPSSRSRLKTRILHSNWSWGRLFWTFTKLVSTYEVEHTVLIVSSSHLWWHNSVLNLPIVELTSEMINPDQKSATELTSPNPDPALGSISLTAASHCFKDSHLANEVYIPVSHLQF